MVTEEQVLKELGGVVVPGANRGLPVMNIVREIGIADGRVDVKILSAGFSPEIQQHIKNNTLKAVKNLDGVEEAKVEFIESKPKEINRVKHVIAVMSGKGGVGKSLVSGLTAVALRRQGYEVGILDADITGPSIPKMFGLTERPFGTESGIVPVSTGSGIQVMSINLLIESEDSPVIWRGMLIDQAINQFWQETLWGTLDYLVVDLPPGTADAPLTVMQTLPVNGVIMVFTPQDLTAMIVRKALNMTRQMDIPVLGVVENMSYLYVPEIDKNIEPFGPSRGEEIAFAAQAPLIARIPIDPALAKLSDEGNIERYDAEIVTILEKAVPEGVSERGREINKMATDPVCGMQVDSETSTIKSEYMGETWYFCSTGCKEAFDADPEKYITADPGPAGHSGHHI